MVVFILIINVNYSSLIKMLDYECKKKEDDLTWAQLEFCIKRNFGGIEILGKIPYDFFKEEVLMHSGGIPLGEVCCNVKYSILTHKF